MSRNYGGGKRQREAERDRRKRDKAERLRRNRMARPTVGSGADIGQSERLPPVALEDVVISVPSQSRRDTTGPVRLFVGGLDSTTSSESLRSAFEPFGVIEDAVIVFDRMTGRSRGFGFVTFAVGSAAHAAMGGMNGRELDGRVLRVNNADSR
jgi:RNA recognition motif-containing protein